MVAHGLRNALSDPLFDPLFESRQALACLLELMSQRELVEPTVCGFGLGVACTRFLEALVVEGSIRWADFVRCPLFALLAGRCGPGKGG